MIEIVSTNELGRLARLPQEELGTAVLEQYTIANPAALMAIAAIARTHFEDAVASAPNRHRARADNFRWWELAFGAELAARWLLLPKQP